MSDVDPIAREHLEQIAARHGRPMRLGCSTVAHRDLGFCAACVPDSGQERFGAATELSGWRLLAIAERGIPS